MCFGHKLNILCEALKYFIIPRIVLQAITYFIKTCWAFTAPKEGNSELSKAGRPLACWTVLEAFCTSSLTDNVQTTQLCRSDTNICQSAAFYVTQTQRFVLWALLWKHCRDDKRSLLKVTFQADSGCHLRNPIQSCLKRFLHRLEISGMSFWAG